MEKTVSSILMSINLVPAGAGNSSVLSGTGVGTKIDEVVLPGLPGPDPERT